MNANAPMHWNEDFDEPWRRLPWVILAALLSWILLLGGFAKMLERRPVPEPPPTTIEARIIELPPPVAGLQGGGSPAGGVPSHAPAVHPAPLVRPVPKPVQAKPKPVHHHVHKVKPKPVVMTEPPSPFGTAKHVEEPAPPIASKGPSGGASGPRGGASTEGVAEEEELAVGPVLAAAPESAATAAARAPCMRRRRRSRTICARTPSRPWR